MKKIKFVCPNCDEEDCLEEVNKGTIFYKLGYIEKQENGSVDLEALPQDDINPFFELHECTSYQCSSCGYVLNGMASDYAVNTPEDLYDWLEARNMLEE